MNLGVIVLTYSKAVNSPRSQYADITVRALLKNLRFRDGEISYFLADDGSYEGHIPYLSKLISSEGYSVATTNTERVGGYGRSYNLITQLAHSTCDVLLTVEDDWELTREFDVSDLVNAIQKSDGLLGCIRLGYIGATADLQGKIRWYGDQTFLQFDPDSPEVHVWTGHPRLESRDFQRTVGEWPEGLDAGSTEFAISKREASRSGVAWPLDIGIRAGQIHGTLFAHIGEVQARTDQIEL